MSSLGNRMAIVKATKTENNTKPKAKIFDLYFIFFSNDDDENDVMVIMKKWGFQRV